MTEEMANSILNNVSKAANTLRAELRVAEQEGPMSICGGYVYSGSDRGPEVHLLSAGWVKLCGIFREYQVEVHGDYDKEKPWNERCFKLWFKYNGVTFFCLMDGPELLSMGHAIPNEGYPLTKRGGFEQWLQGVQSTTA